jgi:hypothetical protein
MSGIAHKDRPFPRSLGELYAREDMAAGRQVSAGNGESQPHRPNSGTANQGRPFSRSLGELYAAEDSARMGKPTFG